MKPRKCLIRFDDAADSEHIYRVGETINKISGVFTVKQTTLGGDSCILVQYDASMTAQGFEYQAEQTEAMVRLIEHVKEVELIDEPEEKEASGEFLVFKVAVNFQKPMTYAEAHAYAADIMKLGNVKAVDLNIEYTVDIKVDSQS